MKIAIIESGGNLQSLKKILNFSGFETFIVNSSENINDFNIYILPGIGSFDNPLNKLKDLYLLEFFSKPSNFEKKKLIGICSGMQILFDKSEEGEQNGLSLIPGNVKRFRDIKYKIPHMGWNYLKTENLPFSLKNKNFILRIVTILIVMRNMFCHIVIMILIFPQLLIKKYLKFNFIRKSHLNGVELFKNIINK